MDMNKPLKVALTLFAASALAVSSFSAGTLIPIKVDPSIKILVNGEEFKPKDANGDDVMTFTYNGTTYAPLRALAEAYGLEVGYDAEKRMATVSDPDPKDALELSDVLYSDNNIDVRFFKTYTEEKYDRIEHGIYFQVTNKTDVELTFQSNSISVNGISYSKVSGSDSVSANSTGFIEFEFDEVFIAPPKTSDVTSVTGQIKVIDFADMRNEYNYKAQLN